MNNNKASKLDQMQIWQHAFDDETRKLRVDAIPTRGQLVDRSGIATAVSTQIMSDNPERAFIVIQNLGNSSIWINFGEAATEAQGSIRISPGYIFTLDGKFVTTQSVFVRSTRGDVPFTAKEG